MQLITFPSRLDSIRERIAVASIYRSHWSLVLSTIESMFDGTVASIESRFLGKTDIVYLTSSRRAADAAAYQASSRHELSIDPGCYPRGSVFPLSDWPLAVAPSSDLPGTDEPHGASENGVGLVLDWSGPHARILTVRVTGPLGASCDPAVAAHIRKISVDLCQAFAISHGLALPARYDREVLETMWDHLSIGVALFNSRLQSVAANLAAQDALTSRRYFTPSVEGSRLKATCGLDNERLWTAAEHVLSGKSDRESFSIGGFNQKQPLPIVFHAITQPEPAGPSSRTGGKHAPECFVALIGSWRAEEDILDCALA